MHFRRRRALRGLQYEDNINGIVAYIFAQTATAVMFLASSIRRKCAPRHSSSRDCISFTTQSFWYQKRAIFSTRYSEKAFSPTLKRGAVCRYSMLHLVK